jgi:hypothetical protein
MTLRECPERYLQSAKSKGSVVKIKGGFLMKNLNRNLSVSLVVISMLIFLGACSKDSSQTISNEDNLVIQTYLDQKVLTPIFSGKVFSAHTVLGTDSGKIYVWALLQEYYKKDNAIERGTGWSVPLVLTVEKGSNGTVIVKHQYPGDGAKSAEDVKLLFPKDLQKEIFNFPATQQSRDLENLAKNRAEQWAKN